MLLHENITEIIIKCFYKVYNELGYGFLEKVYENALSLELQAQQLNIQKQVPINVFYNGNCIGNYFADILVNDEIIVEVKTGDGFYIADHALQLTNYLRATNKEVGLLLYFGKKPTFKRKIFTNDNKKIS